MSKHRYSQDKLINDQVRALLKEGWSFSTGGRHAKLTDPHGKVVPVPGTTGSSQVAWSFRARINRMQRGLPAQ